MTGPLAGLTVVAFEQAVAAPLCTRQLADLGARVIKVERAAGDFARGYDAAVNGLASYFVWLNRSKESIVLDLKQPADLDLASRLVAGADVVVQNLAPGAMTRLGLGPQAALAANPGLVYVSISGYGEGGPDAGRKAYDLLIQCEAGLLAVTGTPQEPAKVGVSIADIAAGSHAYAGTLAALLQRGRTGAGQLVEVSMLEALAEWMQQPYLFQLGCGQPPPRAGAAHPTIAPYGPAPCADGSVFLGVQNDREWERFCRTVIGRDELVGDPRFAVNTARVAHRTELDARIAEVTRPMPVAELTGLLDLAGIANAELRDVAGAATHPQLAARDRWRTVQTPAGPAPSLLPPVDCSWEPRWEPVPALGEHSAAIRSEFAGADDPADRSGGPVAATP